MLYSGEDILERVDEYTLYCSYLGFEPLIGGKYQSPLREVSGEKVDNFASFGIFERTKNRKIGNGNWPNEFMWKDQGLGITGDIFELVRRLLKLETRKKAQLQILIDAGYADGVRSKLVLDLREKKIQGYAKIEIASKDYTWKELDWWRRFNVNKEIIDMYGTKNLRAYWLFEDQRDPRYPPGGMGFAYPIFDKFQLYFPREADRDRRWRTDWSDYCVPGFQQLQYNSELLIITKSMKDVKCVRSFGYEVIAPRGEGIMLPEECIAMMKRKYRKILILFDNDMKHNGHKYEFNKIYVPGSDKDPSDFCSHHGPQRTAEMLRQITEE